MLANGVETKNDGTQRPTEEGICPRPTISHVSLERERFESAFRCNILHRIRMHRQSHDDDDAEISNLQKTLEKKKKKERRTTGGCVDQAINRPANTPLLSLGRSRNALLRSAKRVVVRVACRPVVNQEEEGRKKRDRLRLWVRYFN